VTEKSLGRSFPKEFLAWLKVHPRRERPNIYVDVQQFEAAYQYSVSASNELESRIGTQAMLAEKLAVSDPDAPSAQPPLLVLGVELLHWFRVAPTIEHGGDYLSLGMPGAAIAGRVLDLA
jgi:hypothetical protein